MTKIQLKPSESSACPFDFAQYSLSPFNGEAMSDLHQLIAAMNSKQLSWHMQNGDSCQSAQIKISFQL